ncbi:MAG: hypothetical protein PHW54_07515 [Candidatus Omnitrophica bacterium]|nr:hypothetical protein [Candidatus Omnitrophota bacterium]
MVKKDIYEHLADIYLDASSKKKSKKARKYPDIFQNLFLASSVVIFALIILLFNAHRKNETLSSYLNKNKTINSQIVFAIQPNTVRINFNFDPAKEEAYRINLNELDVARFKALGFLVRKANYEDQIILKVEFSNASNEKSEAYFYKIPSHRWEEYRINLSDFKGIKNWSKMTTLSFVVEQQNVKQKKGIVYLDNIRFLR